MTPEEAADAAEALKIVRRSMAEHANEMLESRRDTFVIGPQTFAAAIWREPENDQQPDSSMASYFKNGFRGHDDKDGRLVTAGAIRFILDWATNDWPMSLGDFLSGMYGLGPWDGVTPPWRLIPTAAQRMNAENLGFGHLYPTKTP